jgi:hypothetical protein
VTIALASSEANTRPPSSVGVDIPATAVTTAANVAGNTRYNPAANVNGDPSPTALGDDADNGGAGNMSVQVAVVSVISKAKKSSLLAYFEGVNWPLNKALPKGAEFLNGPLGGVMRQFHLVKKQVAHQLLNYKKGKYMNTQVSILLNPSDLDEQLHEGMAMSTAEFVSSTLLRICYPDPSSYGSDFCNLCTVMKSLPSAVHTYVWLIANSLDNNCFGLLVGVVESWIHNMSEIFPKTSAGVPNAHLEFERKKETRMHAFANKLIAEYNSSGLSCLEDVSRITFGWLGAFLHWALFMAWSIISKIKLGILSHDDMRDRFSCLLGSNNEDDNQLFLAYIMERYANMQGTYFVKHLKGTSGDQLKKLASCQATRTKVSHAVVYAKTTVESDDNAFIHDDTPECQVLWEMATESVFKLADKLDDSDNKK